MKNTTKRKCYLAIDSILPLEAILQSQLMCVQIAIAATILAVVLWHVDSAAALKCNDYSLESLLAGHLDKGNVHCRVSPVSEYKG